VSTTSHAPRGQFDCTVVSNNVLCREHYRLVLSLPSFPPTQPGQFLQMATGPQTILRRPFSLAGRRYGVEGVELDIIHRVVGMATQWMSQLRPGGQVSVIGPLGNAFTLPPGAETALLVGGGVGIPPMLYLATKLAARKAVAFVGAVTKDLLPVTLAGSEVEEFARYGIASVVSTDDGSFGQRGFVTHALEKYLDAVESQAAVIYTCGPELMMKRVAAIAAERRIECQVAVERAMACGMGTCQSCCIKVRKPDASAPPLAGSEWCYRLACTDGPVFRGAELLW
jgi:dihydroorotate dehydrogenase electron transfer subunit